MAIEINDEIGMLKATMFGKVLVDFWAPWCGPCKAMDGILKTVAERLPADVTMAKVNVEDAPELARAYGVKSIPLLLLFKDAGRIKEWVGVRSVEEIVHDVLVA